MRGVKAISQKLRQLSESGAGIASAGAAAALRVMADAASSASPGSIGEEVGWRVSEQGSSVVGKVGLGVGAGAKAKRPHGRFLTKGTRYITARHFIRMALERSIAPAAEAMRTAAQRKVSSLTR